MCLAAIAIGQHERYPWVLLFNRDDYFSRHAACLDWWAPDVGGKCILSGRDLPEGGTWLGLNEAGHLALLTNVREPGPTLTVSPSRGGLVAQWLSGRSDFISLQALGAARRNGFNLLTADLSAVPGASASSASAWWLSNRPDHHVSALRAGLYGLSNAALDTPWPKVLQLKQCLRKALATAADLPALVAIGLAALADRSMPPEHLLPETGLPRLRELQLAPAFVHIQGDSPAQDYGTRCSTVVVVERSGPDHLVHVVERSFDRHAAPAGDVRITHRLPAQTHPGLNAPVH